MKSIGERDLISFLDSRGFIADVINLGGLRALMKPEELIQGIRFAPSGKPNGQESSIYNARLKQGSMAGEVEINATVKLLLHSEKKVSDGTIYLEEPTPLKDVIEDKTAIDYGKEAAILTMYKYIPSDITRGHQELAESFGGEHYLEVFTPRSIAPNFCGRKYPSSCKLALATLLRATNSGRKIDYPYKLIKEKTRSTLFARSIVLMIKDSKYIPFSQLKSRWEGISDVGAFRPKGDLFSDVTLPVSSSIYGGALREFEHNVATQIAVKGT